MKAHRAFWVVSLVGANLLMLQQLASGISLDKYKELTREELISLDRDVTEFYSTGYGQIDFTNVTYDDQLFRAIRAYRHTILYVHYDYRYSDRRVMEESQGPQVDRNLCGQQLGALAKMAQAARGSPAGNFGLANKSIPMSAINFLETSGRAESGALNGNLFWFGAHSECIQASIPPGSYQAYAPTKPDKTIVGRYCVGHLKARSWPKRDLYFDDRISIKLGLCLPESCHSLAYADDETIRQQVDYLARARLGEPYDDADRYYIDHLYCLPDEESNFRRPRLGTKLFVTFCGFWLALLIYCNLRYGQRMRRLRAEAAAASRRAGPQEAVSIGIPSGGPAQNAANGFDLVKMFSIVANLEHLCKADISGLSKWMRRNTAEPADANGERQTSIPLVARAADSNQQPASEATKPRQLVLADDGDESRVNLGIIDGFRVLTTIHILYGHFFMTSLTYLLDFKRRDVKIFDFTITMLVNAMQGSNIFYIITGTLVTYLAFARQKPRQLFQPAFWILMLVGRYLRLVPLYFLVFWFAKHCSAYMGAGAYWLDYRTDAEHHRTYCDHESWLRMLTITATGTAGHQCIPQAWYLTIDLRNMFIIPFYVILLAWNKFAGYGAILVTFAVAKWRYLNMMETSGVDFSQLLILKPHMFSVAAERFEPIHQDQLIRLSTCLLGVLTGHLLYLYKTRQIEEWPRWFRLLGLKVAAVQMTLVFLNAQIFNHPSVRQYLPARDQVDPKSVAFSLPMTETIIQVSFCTCILLMTTGSGFKSFNKFLSSKFVKILASISYAVYLIHVELMYKFPCFKTEHLYWLIYVSGTFFNVISNLVAFALHVLYEMPINNITRYLLKRVMSKAAKK